MPLDFVLLANNGTPRLTVPLSVDLHHDLLMSASEYQFGSFEMFSDYYSDIQIDLDRAFKLLSDVKLLRSKNKSVPMDRFLDGLEELLDCALSNKETVYVLAD